jgi:ABC-type transport system involved in multi-copper enzyme maturation permease subunit
MDAVAGKKPLTFNPWLPYWAVFQADVHQTLRSWVYRFWVLASLLTSAGFLLYNLGPYHTTGLVYPTSDFMNVLLRWTVLGSAGIIVVLTAGAISSERGTMADSVLSRGISRYQYFLGKWHARLAAVLGTYLILAGISLIAGLFFLHEDLSLAGSLVALLTVAVLLAVVITCSVTVSAVANSTLAGIAVLWAVLFGGYFVLAVLSEHFQFRAFEMLFKTLPYMLRGHYDFALVCRVSGWSVLLSCVAALVGMFYFARRDV